MTYGQTDLYIISDPKNLEKLICLPDFLSLKGQLQGPFNERGECSLAAFDPSNKRIRTKNIFKIYMENFNFFFFSFC